jgi:hypothetical protein
VLAVHGGRVFVGGHIRHTVRANSDYALLAFDAATGETLWEHISDYLDLGQHDFAWSLVPTGDRVLVAGEVRGSSAMIVRAHNASNGNILWEDEISSAQNLAEEHSRIVILIALAELWLPPVVIAIVVVSAAANPSVLVKSIPLLIPGVEITRVEIHAASSLRRKPLLAVKCRYERRADAGPARLRPEGHRERPLHA